jgi:hypothetical protein
MEKGSKVYLASRYIKHVELQTYAAELSSNGYIITSRWIWGSHQISDEGLSLQAEESKRIAFANEDFIDVRNADVVINFTEVPRSCNSRGGRHVEFGLALAWKKRCIVIGHRENIFHCMPHVIFYNDWEHFMNTEI